MPQVQLVYDQQVDHVNIAHSQRENTTYFALCTLRSSLHTENHLKQDETVLKYRNAESNYNLGDQPWMKDSKTMYATGYSHCIKLGLLRWINFHFCSSIQERQWHLLSLLACPSINRYHRISALRTELSCTRNALENVKLNDADRCTRKCLYKAPSRVRECVHEDFHGR